MAVRNQACSCEKSLCGFNILFYSRFIFLDYAGLKVNFDKYVSMTDFVTKHLQP